MNHQTLLFVFLTFFIVLLESQSTFTENNHEYWLVENTDNISYEDAVTSCSSKFQDKLGYLATISSQEEWNWIKQYIATLSASNPSNIWINGQTLANGDIQYIESPEALITSGQRFYNFANSECTGFCDFLIGQPLKNTGGLYLTDASQDFKWSNLPVETKWYLCESGAWLASETEIDELIISTGIPSHGATGVSIIIPPSLQESAISIQFTFLQDPSNSFTQLITDPANPVIDIPPNTGTFKASIVTATGPVLTGFTLFSYQAPLVNAIYPPTPEDIITIVGNNFGTDKTAIIVYFSLPDTNCEDIEILIPHQAITCKIPNTISNYLPIRVRVLNTFSSSNSKISIYDNSKNIFILNSNLGLTYQDNENFILNSQFNNQKLSISYCIETTDQLNLLKSILTDGNHKFWLDGVKYKDGKYQNFEDIPLECIGSPETPTFTDDQNLVFVLTDNVPSIEAASGEQDETHESLVFFESQNSIVKILGNNEFTSSTLGDKIQIQLENYGFLLSPVQIQFDGSADLINVRASEYGVIDYQLPAGYQDSSFKVLVNGEASLESVSVEYTLPSISNVQWIDQEINLLEIIGDNFYNDNTLLIVSVGGQECTNVQFVQNKFTNLQCTFDTDNTVGIFATTVQIGENGPTSPAFDFKLSDAPTITSVTGCAISAKPLTITGTDFGNDPTSISVLLGTDIPCETITFLATPPNTITCILGTFVDTPDNFSVSIEVADQTNAIKPTLSCTGTPIITGILPIVYSTTNDKPQITITGSNLLLTSSISISPATPENLLLADGEINNCIIIQENSTTNQVICVPESTLLNNANITIQITEEIVVFTVFTFQEIEFTSYSQDGLNINIIGSGFGQGITVSGDNQPLDITIDNSTSISILLPNTYSSKQITIKNPLESSVSFDLYLIPIINSYDIDIDTSKITLNCYFLEITSIGKTNVFSLFENTVGITTFTGPTAENPTISYITTSSLTDANNVYISVVTDGGEPRQSNTMIFSISPTIEDLIFNENGTINVQGNNFKTKDDSVATITFAGSATPITPTSFTNTNIYFDIPVDTVSGQYTVTANIDGINSNEKSIDIPLSITTISSPIFNSMSNVIITGNRFCSGANLNVLVDGNTATVVSSSATQIEIEFNSKITITTEFTLKVTCINSIEKTFSYAQLTLSNIQQSGKNLNLTVGNLGQLSDLSVAFSTTPLVKLTCVTDDEFISCALPDSTTAGTTEFTISTAIKSIPAPLTIQPLLTSLKLTTLSTIGGEKVTIVGSFFINSLIIVDNGKSFDNQNYKYIDGSSLEYTSQAGVGKDLELALKLTTASTILTPTLKYSYLPPTIKDIQMESNQLIITGNNFGTIKTDNTINIPNSKVTSVVINQGEDVDNDAKMTLTIEIPITSKSMTTFALTVGQQATDPENLDLVPTINNIEPKPLTKGQDVTISGIFLNPSAEYKTYFITGKDADEKKTELVCNAVNDNGAITCTILPGVDTFSIQQSNGVSSSKVLETSYLPPTITNVKYNYKPILKTAEVTITGQSFGNSKTLPTVQLNNSINCIGIVVISDTQFACSYKTEVPASETSKTTVSISVSKLTTTESMQLSYPKCPNSCGVGGICSDGGKCFCFKGYEEDDGVCELEDDENDNKKPSNTWKIVVGILVPLIFILAIVGAIMYLRARKRSSYERYSNKYFMQMD